MQIYGVGHLACLFRCPLVQMPHSLKGFITGGLHNEVKNEDDYLVV